MSDPSSEDDHPTVIRTRGTSSTGFQPTAAAPARTEALPPRTETEPAVRTIAPPEDSLSLPLGSRLGEFELRKRLGEGGFGIVYQAWDHSLERLIALKEYLPSSIAMRVGQTHITARSERHRETFEAGLKSFINEAKLLARFDHPSLVKVYRFWEANGTAYMAMPFYEGTTMRDAVRAMAEPPDEAWLMYMLDALTEALAVIHAEQCFHRDIAPDNVMLLYPADRPLLLDFGAARRVIGDMTHALTVILKPGYAPIEQYAEVPDMKQGPWTDIYALAAVVYWCITGKTPPPSVGRMLNDSCVPLAKAAAGKYSAGFLEAIDRALVVHPERRTPDIQRLREELGLPPPNVPGGSAPRTETGATRGVRTQAGAPVVPTAAAPAPKTRPRTVAPAPTPAAAPADAAPARRTGWVIGALAGAAALAAGGWWLTRGPAPVAPPVTQAPAPAVTAPAAAPAAAPAPAPVTAAAPPPPVAAPVAPAAPARDVPADAARAADAWARLARAELQPIVEVPAPVKAGAKNVPTVGITSPQAGHLYLLGRVEGGREWRLIHPASPAGTPVAARAPTSVAPAGWATVGSKAASVQVLAIVTREPWDLAADGWRSEGGAWLRAFPAAAGPGAAGCPAGSGPCGDFGLAEFAVRVEAPAATPPAPSPATPRPQATPAPAKPPANEECTRLIQQMSLGDTSPALTARFKALGCR